MPRCHRHSFSWHKRSFTCKTPPRRASIGRCTEWLKEKRYVRVQMGPVDMEVRSRLASTYHPNFLPQPKPSKQFALSSLHAARNFCPPFHYIATFPSSVTSPTSCACHMAIWAWRERCVQKCKHYCKTVVIQVVHIVRILLSRASKCCLKEELFCSLTADAHFFFP